MPSFQRRKQREYIGCFRKKPFLITCAVCTFAALYLGLPRLFKTTYTPLSTAALSAVADAPVSPKVAHLPTPSSVKAIYMTSCVAGTPSFRSELVKLIDETELNSVVIDIKDYSGYLSFRPATSTLADFVSTRCMAPDMKEFLKTLHDKGIYAIGRITVFQDPVLTKRRPDLAVKKASDGSIWRDYKGLSFTDPGAKEVWDHHVEIAKEAHAIGFDELNFDYIRFPSDGPMSDIVFIWSLPAQAGGSRKKQDVLEDFFRYLSGQLKPLGMVISADLFGMTTTNTDDLNIGQVIEKAAPYFDYLAPMVYPSHYPPNFNGWADPNKYPYDVVKFSLNSAVKRFLSTSTPVIMRGAEPVSTTTKPLLYPKESWDIQKLRPWIQDFDYGGNYDIAEVRAQITAVYDAGLTSWMLWAPSNRYTKEALLPE